jgi:hypothetical protein
MSPDKKITVVSDAGLTRLGRWFFTRRRLALILIFAVGVTTPVLVALNWNHKLFFIPLELATKFLIVYPAIRANCRWFGPVVTRFGTQKKAVWLTIDDGPHPEDTPALLKLLKKHNRGQPSSSLAGRFKNIPNSPGRFCAMVTRWPITPRIIRFCFSGVISKPG